MANLASTTSVTRTRSTRAPSNLSRQLLNSGRGTAGATGIPPSVAATTFATSATTAPPPPQSSTSSSTAIALPTISNLSLFLTNLRLLDLDLRPDWPDINVLTFSSKDAAQGQKKRIQCVEWALYHLFALWDHEETRTKLQPFFPPNDQVQSLNLRAALLRGLEQAKKNGALGRDAVVRKTMLDECKGERLEEVLAVFSSAVLKKMVAEQQLNEPSHPALAQSLALEHRGYSGERAELTAMILAHKVSLRRALDEKNAARDRFKDFSELLTLKETTIAGRREQAKVAQNTGVTEEIPDHLKREVRRTVRNNWTGDERWIEALLCGDANTHRDGVMSAPFDRVWRRVQSGRLEELEENSVGLLEQLDDRVKSQKERLEKWQGFRQEMFGKTGTETKAKEPEYQQKPRGIDLGFRGYETLHISRTSPKKLAVTHASNFDHEYETLVKNLKAELAGISPDQPQIPAFFQRSPEQDRLQNGADIVEPESEEISDISDHEKTPVPVRPLPPRREPIRLEQVFEPVLRKAQNFDDDLPAPATPSRLRRAATIQSHTPTPRKRPSIDITSNQTHERRLSSPPKPSFTASPHSKNATIPRSPPPPRTTLPRSPPPPTIPNSPPSLPSPDPPSSPGEPQSPTQELADQILASVNATSPSPVKRQRHTLSLAERTRLSMARRTSQANLRIQQEQEHDDTTPGEDDYLAESTTDPLLTIRRPTRNPVIVPIPASPTRQPNPEPTAETPTPSTGYEDLVARTRRSMAGFEAARQKAQIERRKSLKKSKLPATPAGQRFPALGEDDEEEEDVGNNTTLIVEELLNEGKDDDYEAVFMSRPKIATSPVGTPAARRFSWGLE
ncbi:HAUS augmin-like complex subunit 6 N-terminus-domain-containing protein [Cladorrhinum sp. PSN332]|nr:HAUS augmin-like complex subunit 6 N-terminus-domain-containing protein [Cladorrhinum sp. PSN332]